MFQPLLALLLASALALAPALRAQDSTADPLRIGATISMTGPLAAESLGVRRGLELWVQDLNDRGALLGRPVQLDLRDDASSPTVAAAAYAGMLSEGVGLFVSPYSSELTLAAMEQLAGGNYAMIAITSAPQLWDGGKDPRVFGLYAPAEDNMLPALEVARDRGLRRVAVASLNSEFPKAVARGAINHAKALGLEVVAVVDYDADTNLEPVIQSLKSANPEVLLIGSYMDDALSFTDAARTAGLSPALVVFSGPPALRSFGETLGYATVDGVLSTVQWMRSVRFPGAFDFGFRYRRAFGSYPSYDAAGGYAALQVMEAAIRLADSTEPAAVRRELGSLKFRSILGHFRVDAGGRQIAKQTYLVQWQDSHISLVYPPGIARWDLRFPFSGW